MHRVKSGCQSRKWFQSKTGESLAVSKKNLVNREQDVNYPQLFALCRALPSKDFSQRLIAWQVQQGRHSLPWQNTRDPYLIWLSEIMLQQTQVLTVIPYYQRFLQRFPTILSLATADQDAVLGLWSGLGYYARARNLHRCAQVLVAEYAASFPSTALQIAQLPGIGRSTAAAIAAFAFSERVAILDGNVKRVLTRFFAIEGFPGQAAIERQLWLLAEALLPLSDIEAYTQGLMDLGATLCTRSLPRCPACPLRDNCLAWKEGRTAQLPTPKAKKLQPQRISQVLLLQKDRSFLLVQRPTRGIWGGLWALPEINPGETPVCAAARCGFIVDHLTEQPALRHVFTHFKLDIVAWAGQITQVLPLLSEDVSLRWLDFSALEDAPLPAPIRRLLEAALAEKFCKNEH